MYHPGCGDMYSPHEFPIVPRVPGPTPKPAQHDPLLEHALQWQVAHLRGSVVGSCFGKPWRKSLGEIMGNGEAMGYWLSIGK